MSLRVLKPGTFSLFVDRGRPSSRSLGIPLGGAADVAALSIGNSLAGNPPNAVALEIILSGPELIAEHDTSACIFGEAFDCWIDGRPIAPAVLFHLKPQEILKIGGTQMGARGYLCVHGGFVVKPVLESGSAFEPIAAKDVFACAPSTRKGCSLAFADVNSLLEDTVPASTLRVLPGPQADWFPIETFFERSFTVSAASNRMGIRLEGEKLPLPKHELVSEAVAPGAVQITNDGLPIILGVDGQTIGGYPKIAHVIRADLDRIGQLRPGQAIQFQRIDIEQAETIARERQRKLRTLLTALRLFQHP